MNLSFGKKVLYALGQFGLVLGAFGVGNLFVSFFVTRNFIDTILFPVYINQGYFLGYFTAAGLIIALSKILDALAGLFFGYASDRNTMKKGRRTGFMLIATLPLSIFSVLVFFPPSNSAFLLNSAYVLVCTILFYIFLSFYSAPYMALLAELGKSPRERMQLSTLLAGASALALLLGNHIFSVIELMRMKYALSSLASFRIIIVIYAVVSGICMLIPAFFINEKKVCEYEPVQDSFFVSFQAVLKDAYFRPFFLADMMYRIAFAFTLAGFSYYVTVLLGLSQKTAAFFLLLIFFSNLLLFVPVCILTRFIGKRKMLSLAFLFFLAVLIAGTFAGKYPIAPFNQGVFFALLFAIPLSIFTVVPNALVSDLVYAAERKTGVQRGGMYFGVQSLAVKIGQLVSVLLFPSLMTIGVTATQSAGRMGLRITMIIAAFFSIAGFVLLLWYREKEVTVLLEGNE